MKKDIILVGGGGHCKACIDVIEAEGTFRVAGIIDIRQKLHQKVLGYEVVACDEDIPSLVKRYKYFLITIGQVKSARQRKEKFELIKRLGGMLPCIIAPSAHVAKSAVIDEGTIVMHQACVNAQARIGANCIVNTAALIEHEAVIGSHCHVSTGSVVNGQCSVGNEVFIGSRSVVANNLSIEGRTIIGAGSVVIHSIDRQGTYVGNPVKRMERDE